MSPFPPDATGMKVGLARQFGPQSQANVRAGTQYAVLAKYVYDENAAISESERGIMGDGRLGCGTWRRLWDVAAKSAPLGSNVNISARDATTKVWRNSAIAWSASGSKRNSPLLEALLNSYRG